MLVPLLLYIEPVLVIWAEAPRQVVTATQNSRISFFIFSIFYGEANKTMPKPVKKMAGNQATNKRDVCSGDGIYGNTCGGELRHKNL